MAFKAVVMSAGVFAVKKKFGGAQLLRLGEMVAMLLFAQKSSLLAKLVGL